MPGVPTHPTQAYEILVAAAIIVVFAMLDRERWRGTMLFWFLIMYGLGRAATEFFRADLADRGLIIGPLSLSQVLCLVAAAVSTYVLVIWHKRNGSSRASYVSP
ncbi:MAG: prolipoprotein diacylglyceryl transferase [Planctomycetes bacterium]|nr:prolipoprotein diacylglyceryl transferase [Planctomycetota bacterium]